VRVIGHKKEEEEEEEEEEEKEEEEQDSCLGQSFYSYDIVPSFR
jgi:ribosomal protein L12E/L44/L45/RPP1/RPP2